MVVGDAVEGGTVSLTWPALGISVTARVTEVVPQEKVVLEVGSARLTLEIDPGVIRLTHEGLHSDDEEDGMRSAWRVALAVLGHGLEHHQGVDRRVRWFVAPVRATHGFAHVYFTDASALRQWLARAGGIAGTGEDYQLELADGSPMSGRILGNMPDRDVALSWTEDHNSLLVLRTFPSPRHPEERLIALNWSRWGSEAFPEAKSRLLESSLERLVRHLKSRGNA